MKWLLLIVGLAGGVYAYGIHVANPEHIADPVYAESRVDVEIAQLGRELEYVFVGEMVSEEDCSQRAERYLEHLFKECKECNVKRLRCKRDLAQRYKKLFHGHTTHTTFLSFDKGNRFERNARMVIWGLNEKEAEMACEQIKKEVKKSYEGVVRCVGGRLS